MRTTVEQAGCAHGAPRRRRRLPAALALVILAAGPIIVSCGNPDAETLGRASWHGCEIAVQTRPFPPRPGSNEVVVIVSEARHRPVYDAIVSVRGRAGAPWVQAIEDGHVGVYRRAVFFKREPGAALEIQLQRGGDETILSFPVEPSAAGP